MDDVTVTKLSWKLNEIVLVDLRGMCVDDRLEPHLDDTGAVMHMCQFWNCLRAHLVT